MISSRLSLLLLALGEQISSDERLQIAVKDSVYVAHFDLRPVIFNHAVWLQNVGSNLRSKFDVELRVFNLLRRRPLLLHLKLIQLRAQHAHGPLTVFMLRSLVLAARYKSGGKMRNAYGGIRRIDVLPAFPARTIGIHANFFGLDHNIDAVIDFRRHVHAGERSMPPLGLI